MNVNFPRINRILVRGWGLDDNIKYFVDHTILFLQITHPYIGFVIGALFDLYKLFTD